MKKKVSKAFGKEIYLLFNDHDGNKCWLKAPSWDCGSYWGFGYIETYTNNNAPDKAKDIASHTHWDSVFNTDGGIMKDSFHRPVSTVWDSNEKTILVELFNKFYELKSTAEAAHKNNPAQWEQINVVDIPDTITEILTILSPSEHTPIVYSPIVDTHATH